MEDYTLPLKGRKRTPLKIYTMAGLIIIIIFVNLFGSKKNKVSQKPDDTIDQYAAQPVNPMLQPEPLISTKQDNLKRELEEAKAKDFIERLQSSQNTSLDNHQIVNSSATAATAPANNAGYAQDSNTAYLNNATHATVERSLATPFTSQLYLIGQGKFIFATLAVAINSDLPGQVSAIVNQDIYGEQGRQVLIPRGSRLIGEYKAMLANNQSRLFVVWTRIIQPNAISIMIGSEGTDALSQAGMTGRVDYHFLARYGAATLISLIGAGASTVGVSPGDEFNSMAAYRESVTQAMSAEASKTLEKSANIPPTIHVKQGERVVVFVNKDLDFSRVYR